MTIFFGVVRVHFSVILASNNLVGDDVMDNLLDMTWVLEQLLQ